MKRLAIVLATAVLSLATSSYAQVGAPLFSVLGQEGNLNSVQTQNPPVGTQIFEVVNNGGEAGITVRFNKDVQVYFESHTGAHNPGTATASAHVACIVAPENGSEMVLYQTPDDSGWHDWDRRCSTVYDFRANVAYRIIGRQWNVNADAINTSLVGELRSITP